MGLAGVRAGVWGMTELNRPDRRKVETLQRRADFLAERIPTYTDPPKANRDRAELAALRWAIHRVQAPPPIPRSIMEALREAIELADEGWAYASAYFIAKWDFLGERNRLAGIAGVPEMEPTPEIASELERFEQIEGRRAAEK